MRERATPELVQFSRKALQKGSKSFSAATRLFDEATRDSVSLLYAWCRHCDDVIDGQTLGGKGHQRPAAVVDKDLQRLTRQTLGAMTGELPQEPAFAALQYVVSKHAIDHRHPLDLLEGFKMDVQCRTYHTIEDTLAYCYHVAGVVGVMMANVMGVTDDKALDQASDLGIAFQLTNIVRDVADDAHNGRIYVPRSWLEQEGITVETMLAESNREKLFGIRRRLLELADKYYVSSRAGLNALPLRSRWAVATARRVYREIGREVVRRGPEAWSERASTSKRQKLACLLAGGGTAMALPWLQTMMTHTARSELWTRPRAN
jgi:15-cis-phytoene synthase